MRLYICHYRYICALKYLEWPILAFIMFMAWGFIWNFYDTSVFTSWNKIIEAKGILSIYEGHTVYPPLFPIIFYLVHKFYIVFFNGIQNVLLLKLILKAPIIIATLIIAYILPKFTSTNFKIDIIRFWLWCPSLIALIAIGQYDVISILFILLSLYSMKCNRYVISAIFLAITTCIKQFTVLIIPIFMFYAIYNKKWNYIITYILCSLAITIPFLIANADNFINKVLFFHINRRPIGQSIIYTLKLIFSIKDIDFYLSIWNIIFTCSFILTNVVVFKYDVRHINELPESMAVVLFIAIMINKVVFPHYLLWFCPFIYIVALNRGKKYLAHLANILSLTVLMQMLLWIIAKWHFSNIQSLSKHVHGVLINIIHLIITYMENMLKEHIFVILEFLLIINIMLTIFIAAQLIKIVIKKTTYKEYSYGS